MKSIYNLRLFKELILQFQMINILLYNVIAPYIMRAQFSCSQWKISKINTAITASLWKLYVYHRKISKTTVLLI